jgi:hypothetical protein
MSWFDLLRSPSDARSAPPPRLASPRLALLGTSPGLLRSPGEELVLRANERRPMFVGAMCDPSPTSSGRWLASEASETEGPSGLGRRTQQA